MRGVWCQALSLPWPPVLWGSSQGSATRVSRVRLVWAWGPSTGPTARALPGRRCSPWGWQKGVPGGGAVPLCEGRLGSGAPPPPTARPLGGLSGSATHVLWAVDVRAWGPCTGSVARVPCGGLRTTGVAGGVWVQAPPLSAARPLGGLPGPAGRLPRVRVWVCAVCVVPVRCVPWCWVLPFACPSCALLSGALLRCCAPCVLAVPPSLRASLALLLATSRFFRGFVVLCPFLCPPLARPPPWHARFPCLRPGVCLGLSPCLLPWPRFSGPLLSLLLGPVTQREDWGVWAY